MTAYIHPQVHDKICIAETLHVYRNRAGPAMCEMSVFSREISQLSKMSLPHSLRSLSSFIAQKKTHLNLSEYMGVNRKPCTCSCTYFIKFLTASYIICISTTSHNTASGHNEIEHSLSP